MHNKFWLLHFFGLFLIFFACTAEKTALNPYFDGVTWESVEDDDYKIKITNGRWEYKGELGEATTRLEMIDDKRIRLAHEDGDTFFVSLLNLEGKNFLMLHDSSFAKQYFKSDQFNGHPALDNHDKVDLGFLNLGVSIGQTIPIDSLKDIEEKSLEYLQNSGTKRRGQIVNSEEVFVNLSSENRVLEIMQDHIAEENISALVDKITAQLGFPPSQEKIVGYSPGNYALEKRFDWNLIGVSISLFLHRYLDSKKNQKLNLVGKRYGGLTVSDAFLHEVEIFKINLPNQN